MAEPTTLLNKKAKPKISKITKKEQILSLFAEGRQDIIEIAHQVSCRPSYVASVLQANGKISGYFDLYTHSTSPMNVYSTFFGGRLGFKTEEIARRSVRIIDSFYNDSDHAGDRAAQHHALVTALTMYDRARWSGKVTEAEPFREWLSQKLAAPGTRH